MLDILKDISAYVSVPILIVIGFTFYTVWKKQEELYKLQIQQIQEQNRRLTDDIIALENKIESPAEIKHQIDILSKIFEEKIEGSNHKIEALKANQTLTMDALKKTIETMDPTFTERQASLLRIYRHEARHTTRDIETSIMKAYKAAMSGKLNADVKNSIIIEELKAAQVLVKNLDQRFDIEKILSDMNISDR